MGYTVLGSSGIWMVCDCMCIRYMDIMGIIVIIFLRLDQKLYYIIEDICILWEKVW